MWLRVAVVAALLVGPAFCLFCEYDTWDSCYENGCMWCNNECHYTWTGMCDDYVAAENKTCAHLQASCLQCTAAGEGSCGWDSSRGACVPINSPDVTLLWAPDKCPEYKPLPAAFDWPTVGPILNQGQCGSCYSFAASRVVQDKLNYARQQQGLSTDVVLSPQYVVDCANTTASNYSGCDGGIPATVLDHWHSYGLPSMSDDQKGCVPYSIGNRTGNWKETSAAYVAQCPFRSDNEYCADPSNQPIGYYTWRPSSRSYLTSRPSSVTLAAWVTWMQYMLVSEGPIAISVNFYANIFNAVPDPVTTQSNFGNVSGGHAMTIVGYGLRNGVLSWKVANQWGTDWGANGFMYIQMGANLMGIEDFPTGMVDVSVLPIQASQWPAPPAGGYVDITSRPLSTMPVPGGWSEWQPAEVSSGSESEWLEAGHQHITATAALMDCPNGTNAHVHVRVRVTSSMHVSYRYTDEHPCVEHRGTEWTTKYKNGAWSTAERKSSPSAGTNASLIGGVVAAAVVMAVAVSAMTVYYRRKKLRASASMSRQQIVKDPSSV